MYTRQPHPKTHLCVQSGREMFFSLLNCHFCCFPMVMTTREKQRATDREKNTEMYKAMWRANRVLNFMN